MWSAPQQLIGQQSFEFGVLLLQGTQALGLLQVHAAIFALSAIVGLGADGILPADLLGLQLFSLGITQDADDLFGRVSRFLH